MPSRVTIASVREVASKLVETIFLFVLTSPLSMDFDFSSFDEEEEEEEEASDNSGESCSTGHPCANLIRERVSHRTLFVCLFVCVCVFERENEEEAFSFVKNSGRSFALFARKRDLRLVR